MHDARSYLSAAAIEALKLRVDDYVLEDFGESRALGGDMPYLERLARLYGPSTTIKQAMVFEAARQGEKS